METSLLSAVSGGHLGMKAGIDKISGALDKTTRMKRTGLGSYTPLPPAGHLSTFKRASRSLRGNTKSVALKIPGYELREDRPSNRSERHSIPGGAKGVGALPSAVSIRNYLAGLVVIAGAEARGVVISTNGIYTKNGTTSLKPLSSPHLATLDWRWEHQGTTVLRAARSPVPFLQSQPKDGTQRGTGGQMQFNRKSRCKSQPAVGE
ncbi:hypothetical protein AB5N19_07283 [Seiridium cardinale]